MVSVNEMLLLCMCHSFYFYCVGSLMNLSSVSMPIKVKKIKTQNQWELSFLEIASDNLTKYSVDDTLSTQKGLV